MISIIKNMRIKCAFLSLLLLINTTIAWAETPREAVEKGTSEILTKLKADKASLKKNPTKLFELTESVITPRLDINLIAQSIMGKSWRTATADQRATFIKEFKELMVHTYASALLDYTDQELKVINVTNRSAKEALVKTNFISKGSAPIAANFSLHQVSSGRWLIYDAVIDGINIVVNYRQSIAEEIKTKGIDGMLEELKNKNKKLREGKK